MNAPQLASGRQTRRTFVALAGAGILAAQSSATARAATRPPRQVAATPDDGDFLGTPPTRVLVTFDNEINPAKSNISVTAPGGLEVNAGPTVGRPDRRTLEVPVTPSLPNGLYAVTWVAVGPDGTAAEGTFSFGLRAGARPPGLRLDRFRAGTGDHVTLAGWGFRPGGSVVIGAGDDSAFMTVARAGADGLVKASFAVPADIPFGRQPVVAADADGAKATAHLFIDPGGAPPIKVHLHGDAGHDEATITVEVVNRSDLVISATVVLHAELPAGVTATAISAKGRRSGNRIEWPSLTIDGHATETLEVSLDPRTIPEDAEVALSATVTYDHRATTDALGLRLPEARGSLTVEGMLGGDQDH